MDPVFAFTVDMDWAHPQIIAETIDLLARYEIRATLFITDPAPAMAFAPHELAIHPNFTDREPVAATLARLATQVPGARGLRAHALAYSYRWLADFVSAGLRYDSSVMIYNRPGLAPYRLLPEFWEIPVFWMDYVHLEMCAPVPVNFDPKALDLHAGGVKVFDLHPHHVFLNAESLARYERAKGAYHDPTALTRHRLPVSSGLGIRVLLERVLDEVRIRRYRTLLMSELLTAAERGEFG